MINSLNGIAQTSADTAPLFTKVHTVMTPQRMMNRKQLKSEIKQSKSVIRRKFDKTYKYLSLQLDLDLTSFENTSF